MDSNVLERVRGHLYEILTSSVTRSRSGLKIGFFRKEREAERYNTATITADTRLVSELIESRLELRRGAARGELTAIDARERGHRTAFFFVIQFHREAVERDWPFRNFALHLPASNSPPSLAPLVSSFPLAFAFSSPPSFLFFRHTAPFVRVESPLFLPLSHLLFPRAFMRAARSLRYQLRMRAGAQSSGCIVIRIFGNWQPRRRRDFSLSHIQRIIYNKFTHRKQDLIGSIKFLIYKIWRIQNSGWSSEILFKLIRFLIETIHVKQS